jgi:hypothetical protein
MFLNSFVRKKIYAAVNRYNGYPTVKTFHNSALKYFINFLNAETSQI